MQSLPLEWSQGPHMISQHNKNMTTSRFDIFFPPPSNHLRIAQLMCLWAKSMLVWHSFLYWLQMNELGHVNVGKEIIHQPNSGCLRRQVLIVLMKQVLIKEPRWWGNLITYLDWTPKFEWCVDEPIDEHMFWRIMCCACSNLLKNQHK